MYITILVLFLLVLLVYIVIRMKQPSVIAYVLYHDQQSKRVASIFRKYKWAKFHKLGKDKYFESAFWPSLQKRQIEWSDKKYVGLISYSIVTKQNMLYFPMEKIVRDANGADVVAFYKTSDHSLVAQAVRHHKQFVKVWTTLLGKMGYSNDVSLSRKIPFFPCNCWMAKPGWMRKFLKFAEQVRFLMENDEEIRKLVHLNCDYKGKISKNDLIKISGKPYYTCHPFIMERLPCFFFWVKGATIYSTNVGVPTFYY